MTPATGTCVSPRSWRRRAAAAAGIVCLLATGTVLTASPGAAAGPPPAGAMLPGHEEPGPASSRLDLGPADLAESRSTSTLAPGVTLTQITRGAADPDLFWTLEALITPAAGSPSPNAPARVLSDEVSARETAHRLQDKGFDSRVEEVERPRAADVPPGTLGYRVRTGSWPTQADADAARARVAAAGEKANAVYTGWDGERSDRGPWHVKVVTIDPKSLRGSVGATFGPDLLQRETTTALSRTAGAVVGVNGGFFVFDPAAGAPGDPAGVGVYAGRLLSEPVAGRPALVLRDNARGTAVERLWWKGTASVNGRPVALDGVNRVPGLIRNCGGDPTDVPTARPLHDVTCTDPSEVVEFTSAFGPATPSGPGPELVLGPDRRVAAVLGSRGTSLAKGQTSLQATGALVSAFAGVHVGDSVPVRAGLRDEDGDRVRVNRRTTIVNGGPLLLHDGREEITQARDGMVHPDDPSFSYGWVAKRNPRTIAGVDGQGRTVLVTVDGRSTTDLGLSIPEAADVARSLGLVDAINLDGGGSTTMAVNGTLISRPSDSTGERPVGDAIVVRASRG